MLRRLHALLGIPLAAILAVVALTGVALSVLPALDRLTNPAPQPGVSVAALAEAVAARHERVTAIRQRSDGAVIVAFSDGEARGVERVDPATGAGLGPYQVSSATRFITNLHRAFLLGDAGRAAAGVSALAMLALSLFGVVLLARSLGGAGALLRPIRGAPAQRLHGELGRFAAIGLVVSSLTGVWMSANTFGLVPTPEAASPEATASGGAPAPVGTLAALKLVSVADLRELRFPAPDDRADVYVLRTAAGEAQIDPATGAQLSFTPASALDRLNDVIRMLHTGRGAWALGLALGLSSATVPALALTGFLMWRRRRAARPRIAANVPARAADTVILVGSEGNSTWGFATTLHAALTRAGRRVHTEAMNDFRSLPRTAKRVLVLTSTYGDGGPPASAKAFLSRLALAEGGAPAAVLGFGDRSFPRFCAYAEEVSAALAAKGWPQLLPLKRIDRASAQEFAQWGRDLGAALGHDLVLEHVAERPKTFGLELVEREDYGAAVGAPVAILRFRSIGRGGKAGRLPPFEPGDLLGVLPPGETMPRFYSLASSSRDGIIEVCVRLREGGRCSTFLHGLASGSQRRGLHTRQSELPAERRSGAAHSHRRGRRDRTARGARARQRVAAPGSSLLGRPKSLVRFPLRARTGPASCREASDVAEHRLLARSQRRRLCPGSHRRRRDAAAGAREAGRADPRVRRPRHGRGRHPHLRSGRAPPRLRPVGSQIFGTLCRRRLLNARRALRRPRAML